MGVDNRGAPSARQRGAAVILALAGVALVGALAVSLARPGGMTDEAAIYVARDVERPGAREAPDERPEGGTGAARYGLRGPGDDLLAGGEETLELAELEPDTTNGTAAADPTPAVAAVAAVEPSFGFGGIGAADATGTADLAARARPAPAPPGGTLAAAGHAGGAGTATALPAPATLPRVAASALPTSGVIASTFVGGSGTAARLEDLMDRGVMVDGESVRLGALGELGRLPYPIPARDAVALHAELERTRLLEGGERVHLQVALLAREGERPVRPRMDVRLVLDRSGSMAGAGWDHAIRAAHELVDRLAPGDTLGLVSYSDDATLDLEPARVGDGRAAHAAIDSLVPGGGTNIEAALRMAAARPPRHRAPTDVALVVLVSDGQATVGHTTASELGPIARAMFDDTGALTTTIGLGTHFDEDVMLSIAREGSGSYHFVRRPEDVATILEDELEERALAVAQDLRVRIVLAPGVTAHRIYGSRVLAEAEEAVVRRTEIAVDDRLAHELGIARDRRDDVDEGLRMHIPTFRRGDQHVILLELDVPAGTRTTDVASVFLDYKDLATAENETASVEVTAERTSDAELASTSVRRPVKRTVLAFQAADALQGAARALESFDVAGAHALLEERITLLRTAASLWDDEALLRDATLLSRYERVIDASYSTFAPDERRTLVMAMAYFGDERMN